jgi:hypothetical protein
MQGEGKGATLSPRSRPAGSTRNPRVPSSSTPSSAFPNPPPRGARRLLLAGFPETPTTSTLSAASKLSPSKLSFPPSLCPLFFFLFFLLRLGGDDDGGRGLNRCCRTDRSLRLFKPFSGRRRASERFEVRAAAMMRRERDSQAGLGAHGT